MITDIQLNYMLKKHFAISLMFFSITLLIGHSVIPHHHHDFDDVEHQHHHSNEIERNELAHLLSHFYHAENGVSYIHTHFENFVSKRALNNVVNTLSTPSLLREIYFTNKKINIYNKQESFHTLYLLYYSGLRAPPTV